MLDLLDNVKPFPYHDVTEIFLQDLGATPEKVFKDFQKEPFASASFGQVHAAKLEDGTILAVKILRPGIEEKVAIDFFIIDLLAFFGDIFFKMQALPWKEFASEFKEWTRKELDYQTEAANAERMYQNHRTNTRIVIPKTFARFSTRRILVQEYIDGFPLSRILRGFKDGRINAEQLLELGVDIKEAPKTLTQEILRQYFFDGFMHADLHPGNIILLQNGKIGLVDFGIMAEWIPVDQKSFLRFMKYVGEYNFKEAVYYFADVVADDLKQMIQSAFPASIDQEQIDDFLRIISNHFSDAVEKTVRATVQDLKEMKTDYTMLLLKILRLTENYKIKFPKEMAIFIKALSTLGLVAKEMNYEYRLQLEIKKFFEAHPEDSFPINHARPPYTRINRERALERLNNWLAYLMEVDPSIYKLVNSYITQYNLVDK